ncbi:hypothetical protein GPAL_2188 [Glaciecola pallidula DSM 14239 = ACAM 615]|uniref:Uncharacterized protein n=1 Tax=Brumicola pallidula DSM 14239 = ACAM 615 TaxID=1121922 RepID=K6Y8G6_9ALTE|nr:hypothetical protein GPAL_2188 [Glaciecola pallidula DSM 14239 = ACAM 615]
MFKSKLKSNEKKIFASVDFSQSDYDQLTVKVKKKLVW